MIIFGLLVRFRTQKPATTSGSPPAVTTGSV
jgi:hypothetical protein